MKNGFLSRIQAATLVLLLGISLCSCTDNNVHMDTPQTVAGTETPNTMSPQVDLTENMTSQASLEDNSYTVEPMVMVNGELYFNTGKESNVLRCGMMDGEITSEVASEEIPALNDQSNFGTGYGYQYGANNTIEVNINDKWYIFQKMLETNVHSFIITHSYSEETQEISRSLSPEDFWEIMVKYDALDVTESENQVPDAHYTYSLQLYNEAGELLYTIIPRGHLVEIDGVRYEDYQKNTTMELFLAVDALWEEDLPQADFIPSDFQTPDVLDGVTMEATYTTSKGVSLLFTNNTDLTIHYGDSYILQAYKDEQWYDVDYIIDNWAFTAIGYELLPYSSRSGGTKWSHFHGELSPGTYRIIKDIHDFRGSGDYTEYHIAAEFVVNSY